MVDRSCWVYGSYEAHGSVRGMEKGCVEEMRQNMEVVASPDRVGPAMKQGAGQIVSHPMASGHLARSGGTPNYDSGVPLPIRPVYAL